MRRITALAAVLLVGLLGLALAAPSSDVSLPAPAITTMSEADAAGLGRGGGGGEGARTQVGSRTASLLQNELAPLFFIIVAIALAVAAFQRNAGAAVAILVAAVVVGAFLLVPEQVETLFRSIYQFVL
ncbi:MAG TPA: hypothetical protein VFU11_06900 [Solirubrobacterales bacterium]|nr:hypothetical protein [Solirubrobacterales bacterium]